MWKKLSYKFLATPAEYLDRRLVEPDKKIGIVSGVTDKNYYTSSFNILVYYKISALEALYHKLINASHITYIELDENMSNNLETLEK